MCDTHFVNKQPKKTLVYILRVERRRQTVTLFNGDWISWQCACRAANLCLILHISVDDGKSITDINFMNKNKFQQEGKFAIIRISCLYVYGIHIFSSTNIFGQRNFFNFYKNIYLRELKKQSSKYFVRVFAFSFSF